MNDERECPTLILLGGTVNGSFLDRLRKCTHRGRKPEVRARRSEIEALLATGVGATEAAKQLGIARSSVCRATAAFFGGGERSIVDAGGIAT